MSYAQSKPGLNVAAITGAKLAMEIERLVEQADKYVTPSGLAFARHMMTKKIIGGDDPALSELGQAVHKYLQVLEVRKRMAGAQ